VRRREQAGSALLVSLLILLLAFLVLLAVTARATASSRAVAAAQREALALNAAEAGLAESVQRLAADREPDTARPVSLGAASYEVASARLGSSGPHRRIELRVLGRCGPQEVALRVVLEVRLPPPGRPEAPASVRLRSWQRLAAGA
jgi:Tfp pilus assembly protein PilX